MSDRRCLESPAGAAQPAAAAHRAVLPTYRTERLTLRAPEMSDFPVWRALMVPDEDGFLGGPHSEEEAWDAFCVYVAGWLLHGHGLWTVELHATGDVAGFVHLGLEWDDLEPELGWMILPEFRSMGIATEASEVARSHGIGLLGDGGFVSYVARDNGPSNRLAARLGATRDHDTETALGGDEPLNVWRHGDPK